MHTDWDWLRDYTCPGLPCMPDLNRSSSRFAGLVEVHDYVIETHCYDMVEQEMGFCRGIRHSIETSCN